MADAGWYPDAHDPNQQHYFDGQNWTGQFRPNPAAPSDDTVRRGDLRQDQQWAQPTPQPPAPQYGTPQQAPQYQPAPQAPQYGPPQQQPVQQQPTQQWATPAQGGYGSPQWQGAPSAAPPAAPSSTPSGGRRRRTPLIIAGAVAVVLVAGLITFLVWPSDDPPSITYQGKAVSAAGDTLTSAEKAVTKAVTDRGGAKDADTRCYFARPKKPASGAKSSDIADTLRCGPVLYVDGVKTSAYLSVPFTDTPSGSSVKLEVKDDLSDIEPAALDTTLDLVRPDGKKAPTANGGAGTLAVPQPPAADKDVLTTGTLQTTDVVRAVGTRVVAKNVSVTLVKAGALTRFGEGDDARTAPAGQKLVAFQVSYGAGDVDRSVTGGAMLVSSGGTPRAIPAASGDTYVIAAVPTAGAVVSLTNGGYTQTLSLPDGKPGANSLAVLQRSNRLAVIGARVKVPFALKKGNLVGKLTYTAVASLASLDYWAPGNTNVHASAPSAAILSVRLTYTDKGQTYGFPPSLLKLRIGNTLIGARNVAPGGKVNNVFQVPASYTAGVLEISGSTTIDKITYRVKTTQRIPIRITR